MNYYEIKIIINRKTKKRKRNGRKITGLILKFRLL